MTHRDTILAHLGQGPKTMAQLSNACDRMPFADLDSVLQELRKAGLAVQMKTSTGTVWRCR